VSVAYHYMPLLCFWSVIVFVQPSNRGLLTAHR